MRAGGFPIGYECLMTVPAAGQMIAPSFLDRWKRAVLGKPMITDDLQHEKLSNPVALGALSPDAISSTAYGPEQIMVELMPAAGMAAFVLLLPITGVILLILFLVTASYRQVVMAYTRAGGSYIVARENFGPRIAQVAAAALLIDYVVTVAIQCAAGTVAVASAIPVAGPLQPANQRGCGARVLFCQPSWAAGGGPDVRGADVLVHRHAHPDGGGRRRA